MGCIQVSEVTHALLGGTHSFQSTGGVEVKGKVRPWPRRWSASKEPGQACCAPLHSFLGSGGSAGLWWMPSRVGLWTGLHRCQRPPPSPPLPPPSHFSHPPTPHPFPAARQGVMVTFGTSRVAFYQISILKLGNFITRVFWPTPNS